MKLKNKNIMYCLVNTEEYTNPTWVTENQASSTLQLTEYYKKTIKLCRKKLKDIKESRINARLILPITTDNIQQFQIMPQQGTNYATLITLPCYDNTNTL